jgi:hypothetical protein
MIAKNFRSSRFQRSAFDRRTIISLLSLISRLIPSIRTVRPGYPRCFSHDFINPISHAFFIKVLSTPAQHSSCWTASTQIALPFQALNVSGSMNHIIVIDETTFEDCQPSWSIKKTRLRLNDLKHSRC